MLVVCFCSKVQVTEEVQQELKKPTFDNWQWDDSEMLILLRQMYVDLGLVSRFNIQVKSENYLGMQFFVRIVVFWRSFLIVNFDLDLHSNALVWSGFFDCSHKDKLIQFDEVELIQARQQIIDLIFLKSNQILHVVGASFTRAIMLIYLFKLFETGYTISAGKFRHVDICPYWF